MKLKLLGTGKEPLSLKLGDNIKIDLGSRIFKPLTVTENGTYVGGQEDGMLVGFTPVNVNVQPKIEPLEVTKNGIYNSEEVDGYKPVVVDVPVPSDTTAQVGDILEGKTAYIEGLKQIGILKAKKFTTGTVTFATETSTPVITHNLGVIPTTFIMIVKDKNLNFTFNTENTAIGGIYGYELNKFLDLSSMFNGDVSIASKYGYTIEWRNNNTNKLQWTNANYGGEVTETTIKLGYRSAGYKYIPNQEYEWIAIE